MTDLAELKDFQRDTARYVFRRLYLDPEPARRFLVADEVGLGKTLVARGVLKQALDHLREQGQRPIRIVHVCSNAAIARQNLSKLTHGLDVAQLPSRLALLPGQSGRLRGDVTVLALTPGTSLQRQGNPLGAIEERALALRFLAGIYGESEVDNVGVYRAFAGTIGEREGTLQQLRARFEDELTSHNLVPGWGTKAEFEREFRQVSRAYKDKHGRSLREDLRFLAEQYRRTVHRDSGAAATRTEVVRHALEALAATGAALVRPDLVIFDEFQRFADLMCDDDTDVRTLMGRLLETKALLLSATPYRMHTTDLERAAGEDDHYQDLVNTIGILLGKVGKDRATGLLRRLREALLRLPHDGVAPVRAVTGELTTLLRSVMVRTERLGSTPDREGMLKPVPQSVAGPTPDDLRAYLAATRAADAAMDRSYDVIELWKSTPYLMSFLGSHYQVKRSLGRSGRIIAALAGTPAVLPWDAIETYAPIDPGNPRMRRLIADTAHARRLLWLPPAAPYYEPGEPFDTDEARLFTKRLVFSAWHAVPDAISVLVSYEAERATNGARGGDYAGAVERATRPLRAENETTQALLKPSLALTDLVDPLALAVGRDGDRPTWAEVLDTVRRRLAASPVVAELMARRVARRGDPRWYVEAMARLDGTDEADDDALGAVPADLVDVLAEVALASPAVCALRALRRVLPDAPLQQQLEAAATIADGFRGLFNGPEATAIVRQSTADEAFWRECLSYSASGNLQAVLDEYLHLLTEWRRFDASDIDTLSKTVRQVLNLQAASHHVNVVQDTALATHSMRARYAIRYNTSETRAEFRPERVAEAFNSPFWPFALATTSVGQEGLDFHLYCHAVVHWNLPHNPVDLEQREGRVHRYKGHAVRKNVAEHCGLPATADGDPWQAMFAAAAATRPQGETEIVPYWVFDGDAKIERHLFMPPHTREASVQPHLLDSTALYRVAFGQPRQEELLRGLRAALTDDQLAQLRDVGVDLTPPRHHGR